MSKTAEQKKREADAKAQLQAELQKLEQENRGALPKAQGDQVTPPAAQKTDQDPDAPGKATEGREGGREKVVFRLNPTRVQMRTYIVEWHWSGTCFHQHFHASDPAGLLQYVARVLGGQDAKIILDYDPLEIANQSEEPDEK